MVKPINYSIKAKGHTAQYSMHKYFARRPYNVFRNLIEHYTSPDDIILDCFCGGGVTIFEALSLNRKVIGVDINPLATFITEMQIQQVNMPELKKYFIDFYDIAYKEFNPLYATEVKDGQVVSEWTEWIYDVVCPECREIISLSQENKIANGKYRCPNPECISNNRGNIGVDRIKCKPHSSTPVRMRYNSSSSDSSGIHFFTETERQELIQKCNSLQLPEGCINIDFDIPKNWDRWYEDCLPQKGVLKFSDLFTKRNLYINVLIFNKILSLPKTEYRDLLYFAFSASLRYTNIMSRVTENWENGNPTCMDKHAYWLPNEYVECNILNKLKDRMNAVLKGLSFTMETMPDIKRKATNFEDLLADKDYLLMTRSSADLPIPDEAIDAVITDPPYGSNVQYGELSSFWNVWYMRYQGLDNFIYNDQEAVSNRKNCFPGAKSVDFYGDMLYKVLSEANRVLKPGGYLVFTFNNKNINVWVQLLKAVVRAGFYLPEGGIVYQDFIKEYKNTSHLKYSGNIHGDFIYSFQKGTMHPEPEILENFEQELKETIFNCITKMYSESPEYTTTELYERIHVSLVRILMQYILADENSEDEFEKIENLSNSFIDNVLSQHLNVENNKWRLKKGIDLC